MRLGWCGLVLLPWLFSGPTARAADELPTVEEALAAIEKRDGRRLDELIKKGLNVNDTGGRFDESLLNNAILLGRPEAAAALIAAGADIEARTGRGAELTPLCRAANVCDLATAKLLLARGADVNRRSGGELFGTPLTMAVSESFFSYGDCYAVFTVLLEHGANARGANGWFDGKPGQSALMLAAYKSDHRYAEQLLRRGADPNLGWNGTSVLETAIAHLPVVSNFERKADEPLVRESVKVVELLIQAGARVDVKTKAGLSLEQLIDGQLTTAATVAVDAELHARKVRSRRSEAARFYAGIKGELLALLKSGRTAPPPPASP